MKTLRCVRYGGVIMGVLLALGCSRPTMVFARSWREQAVAIPAPAFSQQAGQPAATGWAVQIHAGGGTTCALTADGRVQCWGANACGELGDGSTRTRAAPVTVTGLDQRIMTLAGGGCHVCAVTADGGVKCWGGQ